MTRLDFIFFGSLIGLLLFGIVIIDDSPLQRGEEILVIGLACVVAGFTLIGMMWRGAEQGIEISLGSYFGAAVVGYFLHTYLAPYLQQAGGIYAGVRIFFLAVFLGNIINVVRMRFWPPEVRTPA